MGETIEKIYCCDRGDNDNTLAAANIDKELTKIRDNNG